MNEAKQEKGRSFLLTILFWGTLWGIFEATAGYLLHQLPFSIGWFVWYPAACFFMANVYRRTGSVSSILYVGVLCASIKLLNLFLPVRVDKVINPAISIVFEALAMAAVVYWVRRTWKESSRPLPAKAAAALLMNTGWRLLFVIYLLFLVPGWIREISVISSTAKFLPFFATQNLFTSVLLFIGYRFKQAVFRPVEAAERAFATWFADLPENILPVLKIGTVCLMLCLNIVFQFIL